MITLVLESSTYSGSVALLNGATLLGERRVAMRGRDHETLMPAVAALLAEHGVAPGGVGRVVCGAGPGAFTSLRISGAIAKGIAMAAGAPLVPVSSLALVVASHEPYTPGRYLAAVNAMRGEYYVQLFEIDAGGELRTLSSMTIVSATDVERVAAEQRAQAIGPDSADARVSPLAAAAARIMAVIEATPAADLAAWEPAYGRVAEAQAKWEAAHGAPLACG